MDLNSEVSLCPSAATTVKPFHIVEERKAMGIDPIPPWNSPWRYYGYDDEKSAMSWAPFLHLGFNIRDLEIEKS